MKDIISDFKKVSFLILVLFSTAILKAQESGISLVNKKTNKTVFLKENKRILVKTNDGKFFKGRFKTLDDKRIKIGKDTIAIDSVVKLKRRSVGLAIVSAVVVGGIGTPIIIACISTGGITVLFIPAGVAIDGLGFIIPSLPNGHKKENWDYAIVGGN